MRHVEALAEGSARGELSPSDIQAAIAILLRDLLSREGPSGVVSSSQDDVPTKRVGP